MSASGAKTKQQAAMPEPPPPLPPAPPTPLYLDYAATTPVADVVAEAMSRCLTVDGQFGNPASRSHWHGWQADEAVETARTQVADLLGCSPLEIVWTSGATEANNLAIKGTVETSLHRGNHIVTSAVEHKAVLDVVAYLERHAGCSVTYLAPESDGRVNLAQLKAALRPDTVLISLMHINNEIGTILPLEEVGALAAAAGVPLHVDAAQSFGKLPLDLAKVHVDLMSFSAHKIYGPKGAGALYVRRQSGLRPAMQMHGGGHEHGLRSGTLATHQIVGLGAAAARVLDGGDAALATETKRLAKLRQILLDQVYDALPNCSINGNPEHCFPGILNLAFAGTNSDSLLAALNPYVSVSSGSACTSLSVEPSHVLEAMGVADELAHSSLRFSFGQPTTAAEVENAAAAVLAIAARLG